VFVGKAGAREVDFVAQRGSETVYYQVAATVRDVATLKRELHCLKVIRDNYPKYLLTLDDDPPSSHDGILQMNALDFLFTCRRRYLMTFAPACRMASSTAGCGCRYAISQ